MEKTVFPIKDAKISERLLHTILTSDAIDALFFKDSNGRYLMVNQAFLKRYGLEKDEEVIGKTPYEIFDQDVAEEIVKEDKYVLETGKPIIGKVKKVRVKNGQVIWVSTSKVPVRDEEGRIIGLIGVNKDITDYKLKEEEELKVITSLLQELTFKSFILDSLKEGVIVCTKEGKVIYANESACNLLGYTQDDVVSGELERGLNQSCILEKFIEPLIEGEPSKRITYTRRDGTELVIEILRKIVKDEKRGEILNIIIRDVTEEYEIKRKLINMAFKLNRLFPGGAFIFESHEMAFKAYVDLTFHGIPGLCILRENPRTVMEKYGIKSNEMRIISTREIAGFKTLPNLQAISLEIADFLKSVEESCVILLDGLEYLSINFGFENLYRFLEEKRFDIIEKNAVMIIPVDLDAFEKKEQALLLSIAKVVPGERSYET